MKKIPSVFQRNYDTDRLIRDEVVPGCEWVLRGEGWATRKWDGACCCFIDGVFYKRYDAKHGKAAPDGFIEAMEADPVTGHRTGWVRVGDGPEDRWFREAANNYGDPLSDATFEACGPHFNSNPEGFSVDTLKRHGCDECHPEPESNPVPRDFEGIKKFLEPLDIEGIVFYHPDGRMAKVKKKDFGMKGKPA